MVHSSHIVHIPSTAGWPHTVCLFYGVLRLFYTPLLLCAVRALQLNDNKCGDILQTLYKLSHLGLFFITFFVLWCFTAI